MNALAALDLIISLSLRLQQASQIVRNAQAEGRDTLTEAEATILRDADQSALDKLDDAIDKARTEGR